VAFGPARRDSARRCINGRNPDGRLSRGTGRCDHWRTHPPLEQTAAAAFSNIGLQVSWCAQGKEAAAFWGKLFNVDVTWFDPELSATQQLAAVEEMASRDWDFVAIQAVGIDTLVAPVNRMIDRQGFPSSTWIRSSRHWIRSAYTRFWLPTTNSWVPP
jgi:hypothetical protein